ncbi:MAG TPA: hypothetical protein VKA94_03090 [Hyphomicrobiales bacterium]|nr:hypothetical protein [Hyphomicrobiales bacterium]
MESLRGRFIGGLLFGAGFLVSFAILYFFALSITEPHMDRIFGDKSVGYSTGHDRKDSISSEEFSRLTADKKIARSSVVMITRYVPSETRKRVQVVAKDIFKKRLDIKFKYHANDRIEAVEFYPHAGTPYGDGSVIFFTGIPPAEKLEITYTGDKVAGLGSVPLDELQNLCESLWRR